MIKRVTARERGGGKIRFFAVAGYIIFSDSYNQYILIFDLFWSTLTLVIDEAVCCEQLQ